MVRRFVDDAVHDRVAHVDVGMRHVDPGAQHAGAVGELAVLHAFEQVEILFDGPVAIGRIHSRFGQRAAAGAHFLGALIVHVGQPLLDQSDGPFVEPVEVVGGVGHLDPFDAQPARVVLNGLHVLGLFLGRVGVVKTQDQLAAVFLGDQIVDHERLDVADVQVAVRLRREARADVVVASRAQVFCDGFADEISGPDGRGTH